MNDPAIVEHYTTADYRRWAGDWELIDGEYRKVGDFHDETQHIALSKCAIDLDFSRLWRRLPNARA